MWFCGSQVSIFDVRKYLVMSKNKKYADGFKRFDMNKKPMKCLWFLKPVAWLISFPGIWAHRTKITKIGMEGVKPPFVLLGNHNAFYDMNVSSAATFPYFGNYVVAIDGFIGREWLNETKEKQ